MNDQQIVEGLKTGLGNRKYETVARYVTAIYAPKVKGFVRQNNGSDADGDDIFEETFIDVLKNVRENRFKEHNFGGYFMIIARNKWLDELEKRKKITLGLEVSDFPDDEDDVVAHKQWLDSLIRYWVDWDNEDDKELLSMKYEDGMKSKEIAEFLGIEDNTVRQRLKNAKERFRHFVAEKTKQQ